MAFLHTNRKTGFWLKKWETLSSEARNLFTFLEKEPTGALSEGVVSAGDDIDEVLGRRSPGSWKA